MNWRKIIIIIVVGIRIVVSSFIHNFWLDMRTKAIPINVIRKIRVSKMIPPKHPEMISKNPKA
ncbi:hypothetical protein [Flavobacterium sp.]|uniref:hypothetical protein n=1 Tax=Flavobacterium sp. TaxID=239 RepID=UPI002CC58A7E|nr:hypothetical protein [Flavobacterium sp.]HSD09126.1 hypothetical protein [Flavobacterium sp.]